MNSSENDCVESAAIVYFGKWVDSDLLELQESQDTPETILLRKSRITTMSDECQHMLKILLDLPEEMYRSGGQLNLYGALKIVKNVTGWPMKKVLQTEALLRQSLKDSIENG